ncbi:hypothetical protein BCR42DRAFT_455471 [Absidia repens]|uniref:RRM domain-containing protein n=1 Tax=Absidia repens TaxID=90262 RepID=A0A1X2I3T8_9FUNG|nr:hypothetical protein BCR42DRAFT_455471 [Absidia repens]
MPHLASTISPTTTNAILSHPPPSSDVPTTTTPPPSGSTIFNTTSNINNVLMQPVPPLQPLPPLNLSANNGEEISTIFVVGFPEDMLEREFQNMFIFSPGFEAATLKIPNKDQEDDLILNNSNNVNGASDNSEDTGNHASIDGNEPNGSNSSNKMTTTTYNYNNSSMRKQIIGFAKFRNRIEALEARDIINGRKVDAEKGSVLKAEMAKKNLHTKRGLSLEPLQQQQVVLGFPTQAFPPPINPPSYPNVSQQQLVPQHQPTPPPPLTSPITNTPSLSTSASVSVTPTPSTVATAPSTTRTIRFNTSNAIHHAAYEAFYSVPSSDSIDLFSSVTSPTAASGDHLSSDLFSPTVATGSSSTAFMFSPSSNRTLSSSSFDLRTSSVGDIFNSTPSSHHPSSSTHFPLSSSLSSSSAAIRGSGFNTNAHRLSSKHIFDMDKDTTYLSKSTPTSHFFPLHDGIIHPTSLASTASSSSSAASSLSSIHHPHYSQPATNAFNHNNNPGSSTNVSGLSSVMEETGDGSTPTTPPESMDIENKDGFTPSWQTQQHRSSLANVDMTDIHQRVNGLAINVNTAHSSNLVKGMPPSFSACISNNDTTNKLTSPTGTATYAPPPPPPTAAMMMTNNTDSSNGNSNGLLRNYNGNGVIIGSTNPADQNPPCNTLYVGNLPPNTNEDELKQMFSKCYGYKRLSFRNKANGPMCFVEFVDVMCATQALQDLYGNPLSNSVKGGIRLSFSKNPLGVRQQPPMAGPNTMFVTTPPPSASNMNFGLINGFPPMNYTRRESMTFDPQLS